jgi:hypothetical protein
MCEKKLGNIFNDVSKIVNLKFDLQKYIAVNVKNSRFHFLSYCKVHSKNIWTVKIKIAVVKLVKSL